MSNIEKQPYSSDKEVQHIVSDKTPVVDFEEKIVTLPSVDDTIDKTLPYSQEKQDKLARIEKEKQDRLTRLEDVYAQREKKIRLCEISGDKKNFLQTMHSRYGLLPEDLSDVGNELVNFNRLPDYKYDIVSGSTEEKWVEFDNKKRCAFVKRVRGEYVVTGRKKGDPGYSGNIDEKGNPRICRFREDREAGTYFIGERFAKIFADMFDFGDYVPDIVITRDAENQIISRSEWKSKAKTIIREGNFAYLRDLPPDDLQGIEIAILHGLLCDSDKGQHLGNMLLEPDSKDPTKKKLFSIDHALVLADPEQQLTIFDEDVRSKILDKIKVDVKGEPIHANFSSLFLQKFRGAEIPEKTMKKLRKMSIMLDAKNIYNKPEQKQIERFSNAMNEDFDYMDFLRKYVQALIETGKVLNYNDLAGYRDPKKLSDAESGINVPKTIEETLDFYVFREYFPKYMKEVKKNILEKIKEKV